MLEVKNLSVRFGALTIVDDVSFSLAEHSWLMAVGPNGAGKTTLVNAISQGIPYEGTVLFEHADVSKMKPLRRAKSMGVLTQSHHMAYSFTVEEIVRLGRYAYAPKLFSVRTDEDEEMVEEALRLTGMLGLRAQSVLTLSGGELQRAFLAQVFAQNPKLLILDEPTNNLDLVYQKQMFELIGEWVKKPGRAVISVVHDLALARSYGTHAMLLNKGKLVACGEVGTVLTRENLSAVYAVDVYQWMKDMLSQWS
ncbi:MAG TPA: ABC transporter ATP-binding protein [Clostridia bacterium]|nr:ABC transporter ATP-binding protein [Clostridia bacterium]